MGEAYHDKCRRALPVPVLGPLSAPVHALRVVDSSFSTGRSYGPSPVSTCISRVQTGRLILSEIAQKLCVCVW